MLCVIQEWWAKIKLSKPGYILPLGMEDLGFIQGDTLKGFRGWGTSIVNQQDWSQRRVPK